MDICLIKLRQNAVYETRLGESLSGLASKFTVIQSSQLSYSIIDKYNWFFVIGCSGTRPLFDRLRLAGKNVVLVDKGYWAGRNIRDIDNYWRFSVNSFQPYGYVESAVNDCSRLDRLGVDLNIKERTKKDRKLLIFFSGSAKYHKWHNTNVDEFNEIVLSTIRQNTQRPIIFLSKESSRLKVTTKVSDIKFDSADNFKDYIDDCHCLITHGSNVLTKCAVDLVPTIVYSNHPLRLLSFSIKDLSSDLEVDWINRDIVLNNLSYCQWTFKEINNYTDRKFIHYLNESRELNETN